MRKKKIDYLIIYPQRMDLDALNKLKEKLEVPQNSVIVTHRNPDGDTMGSILGMFWFLKSMGLNSFTTSKH